MRVLKFGGTSVANAERLAEASHIILDRFKIDGGTAVVVSAFSGMTDLLLRVVDEAKEPSVPHEPSYQQFVSTVHEVASSLLDSDTYDEILPELNENHEKLKDLLRGASLVREASKKTRDLVVSFGERNCAYILANYLKSKGHPAQYVDATKYISTFRHGDKDWVDFNLTNDQISSGIKMSGQIHVITGFIGADKTSGITTTLGRGGSDYSAAIFAAALDVDALEIWTDVNGVLTTDPRKVKQAYTIPEMTYTEAAEMSHFGAKVLYAPTVKPVKDRGIPIYIKNTLAPEDTGTKIHDKVEGHKNIITGLSSVKEVSLLSLEGSGLQGIPGIASRFFKSLADGQINIIMITQASSEHSICVAINEKDKAIAQKLVSESFSNEIEKGLINPLRVTENLCLLAVVGENMKNTPGVAGRLFSTLGQNGINLEALAQGSSEFNITFAINAKDEVKALNAVHDAFFLSEYKTVHLFMVGVGLIGSTLIDQIIKNKEKIQEDSKVSFVINGLSNSRKMAFDEEGVAMDSYVEFLEASEKPADIEEFIDKMISYDFANSIFVDNTASEIIPEYYERILTNNIGISTPNKIALSSGYERYKKLKQLAGVMNTPLNFETNVGAGLPVISTLKSLVSSGDKVRKIEAVLSGSVSYIFNTFSTEHLFSEVVMAAQKKGYTEPDPREDLSGSDVKRKLLILARESGFEVREDDITVKGLLSNNAIEAETIEGFYKALTNDNTQFARLVSSSESRNERLRFIAQYESGFGSVALRSVDTESPFYGLSGSDNMIVIYSDRYHTTPLVIRGPGAGAEVTAAGVLAEIINMSSVLK